MFEKGAGAKTTRWLQGIYISTGSGLLINKLVRTFPKSFLTGIGNIRRLNVKRMSVEILICISFF